MAIAFCCWIGFLVVVKPVSENTNPCPFVKPRSSQTSLCNVWFPDERLIYLSDLTVGKCDGLALNSSMSATKVTRSVSTNRQVKEAMVAKKLSASDAGILAAPLSVEGIDDSDTDGHIPLDILRNGTRIVIPYWPSPLNNDELWISLFRNGVEQRLYTELYSPPQPAFLYFRLTPQHLATDGIVFLSYKVWKGLGGNPDPSPERKLTIDHSLPVVLDEPTFRHATIWGYLNNKTFPPLTSGATVAVPASTGIAVPGDIAKVHWQGYLSLNGSGPPVTNTYGDFDKTLQQQDINNGYEQVIPFDPHIKFLFDNDSALVHWQLLRKGRLIGESQKGLVKIDRVTPGESGPSGLNIQGETKMAIGFVPKQQRAASLILSGGGALSDIAVDTLADGFIAKPVLDSGILNINFTRSDDEFERDTIDVKYREKGEAVWIDYPATITLGPIAGRPPTTIPLSLNATHFAEKPTSTGPTVWELMIELFKDNGGNADPSNILEFTVDQLAPVNTKNPPRRIRPTPAPAFVNGTPLPTRTIDRTWINANTDMNFTVSVTYLGRRLDDILTVWLLSGTQKVQVYNTVVVATGALSIPSSELLQFPNGRVNISYRWDDWLGNLGEESTSTPVLTLALPQAPLVNRAPLVPETDPNYSESLYWENFEGGIAAIVQNASIAHAEPGDQVLVVVTDPADVTNYIETAKQPWANANLSFDLSYEDLDQIFADADEPKDVTIHCEIERTGIPNAVSPSATITLAFDIAGVKPTNPPDLNNPDLQLPVVRGESDTPNIVLATDRDKPGKFKVTNGLQDPDFSPEHTVKCYLGGSTIPFTEFSPLVNVSEFEVTIPASEMAKLTPPSDVARYTIQKTGVDKNVNKSLPQTVVVNQIPVVLPDPTIRIRNPTVRDYIECYAMTSPTSSYELGLQIKKDPLLPPGTVITARFEAHRNAAGTDLIAGTADSKDYTIAAVGTPDVASVGSAANFKAAQPVRGAVAFGKYWYTALNGQQSSTPIIKPLDTINNSFQYCDLTLAAAAPGP
ncbi:hypothetical protein [Pseudomonas sp. LB1P83]